MKNFTQLSTFLEKDCVLVKVNFLSFYGWNKFAIDQLIKASSKNKICSSVITIKLFILQ